MKSTLTKILAVALLFAATAVSANSVPGIPTPEDRAVMVKADAKAEASVDQKEATDVPQHSTAAFQASGKPEMVMPETEPAEIPTKDKKGKIKPRVKTAAEIMDEKTRKEELAVLRKSEMLAGQDKRAIETPVEEATQRPVSASMENSKTTYAYMPNSIYMVYGAPYKAVDIQLQPGEQLSGQVVAGDTVRWVVGTTTSGSDKDQITHVLIKPIQAGLETNILIFTNRRTYQLKAKSTRQFFTPAVGWSYPADEMAKHQIEERQNIRNEEQNIGGDMVINNINFDYKIKPDDDYPWTPVRVFDDGAKTYVQMSAKMKHTEAPALFIKDKESGELNLVNYRVKGDYYIVDRLFKVAELRIGKKDLVELVNNGK